MSEQTQGDADREIVDDIADHDLVETFLAQLDRRIENARDPGYRRQLAAMRPQIRRVAYTDPAALAAGIRAWWRADTDG